MIDKPTECQCPVAGYCKLLKRKHDPPQGRKMSEVRYKECKHKPHYFEMFYNESENGENPSEGPSRGLGDTIAKGLKKIGIQPCGSCEKRQEALNDLFPYKEKD